jgi:hypothetical protein
MVAWRGARTPLMQSGLTDTNFKLLADNVKTFYSPVNTLRNVHFWSL